MVPPGADAIGTAGFAVIGLASLAFKPDDTSTTTFVLAELAMFGAAAVFGYSAWTGYKSVKRCRELNRLPATPALE